MSRIPALQDLLGLARGDEYATGYVHEGLYREICRKLKPATLNDLLHQLWPEIHPDQVEDDAKLVAAAAFEWWQDDRKRAA